MDSVCCNLLCIAQTTTEEDAVNNQNLSQKLKTALAEVESLTEQLEEEQQSHSEMQKQLTNSNNQVWELSSVYSSTCQYTGPLLVQSCCPGPVA